MQTWHPKVLRTDGRTAGRSGPTSRPALAKVTQVKRITLERTVAAVIKSPYVFHFFPQVLLLSKYTNRPAHIVASQLIQHTTTPICLTHHHRETIKSN